MIWLLGGIALLLIKVAVDSLIKIPFANKMVPQLSLVANAWYLYPLAAFLIIYSILKDWKIAGIVSIILGTIIYAGLA